MHISSRRQCQALAQYCASTGAIWYLNVHSGLFIKVGDVLFDLSLPVRLYFVYANGGGSGETALIRRCNKH